MASDAGTIIPYAGHALSLCADVYPATFNHFFLSIEKRKI
jgi:hypothetical protein